MAGPAHRRSSRSCRQSRPGAAMPPPENRPDRCRRLRQPEPPSHLRLWQVDDETLEFWGDDQLAAQPAVWPALARGEFKHRLLVVRLCRRSAELVFLDIDVTGGAHHLATAFGNDAVDAVEDRAAHHAGADRDIERLSRPVGVNIRDLGHRLPIGWIRCGSRSDLDPLPAGRRQVRRSSSTSSRCATSLAPRPVLCRAISSKAASSSASALRTVRLCRSWRTNWNAARATRSRSHDTLAIMPSQSPCWMPPWPV